MTKQPIEVHLPGVGSGRLQPLDDGGARIEVTTAEGGSRYLDVSPQSFQIAGALFAQFGATPQLAAQPMSPPNLDYGPARVEPQPTAKPDPLPTTGRL